jgi:outer membrane protein OmpA-like peptidoglycan-associated protein
MNPNHRKPSPEHLTRVTRLGLLTRVASAACAGLLVSCSTPKPPTPPAVDESTKRPANDPQTLQMLRLQGQVHNLEAQLNAQAQQRQADALAASATAAREAADRRPDLPAAKVGANQVFVMPYGFGKTDITLGGAELARLVDGAKAAAYVLIRGRTDGTLESLAEARVARDRAAGMKAFLVGAGVDATKIRVTYQPTGDHLSDNASAPGRDLNRRVEVEIYSLKPLVSMLGPASKAQ